MSNYAEQAERDRIAAQLRDMQDQFARLQRERGGFEIEEMRRVQAHADSVMALHGKRARDPSLGETPLHYRAALAQELAAHSPSYKDAVLATYDAQSVHAAEDVIYNDAVQAARNAANGAPGLLVSERYRDESGRMITRWNGDPMAWMQHFMTGGAVGRVIRPRGKAPGT